MTREYYKQVLQAFVEALDQARGANTAFFKINLNKENAGHLHGNPYKTIELIVKSDFFNASLLQMLNMPSEAFKGATDIRGKPTPRVKVQKKLNKKDFISELSALLSGSGDSVTVLSELVEGLFDVDVADNPELEEELDYQLGSQGRARVEKTTLFDFISTSANGKLESPKSEVTHESAEKKSSHADTGALVEKLARSIPFGWSFVSLETSGLLTNAAAKDPKGPRNWYFNEAKGDRAYVWWNNEKEAIFFLFTNGTK